MPGHFVISLDFELFWGVRDHRTIQSYGPNILGVRKAIPGMLALFKEFNIRATFSTVGFLFFEKKSELLTYIPSIKPEYSKGNLNPYQAIDSIGENEISDPYHFGASLIKQIQATPGMEIGTHTFSHYYCLEDGQTAIQFDEDLKAAKKTASAWQLELKSIVFPRNQYNPQYLSVCKNNGIMVYRGNEIHWLYAPRKRGDESKVRRLLRLIDSYINISGHHIFKLPSLDVNGMVNVPASRFLRPYSNKLSFLEWLRIRRIKSSMTQAAIKGEIFHLWWHPHNFGANTEKNLEVLKILLQHFRTLQSEYQFQSSNMADFLSTSSTPQS